MHVGIRRVYSPDHEAVQHVADVDPQLARLIAATGDYVLDLREDRFAGLARAVVGQQLSVAAARSIWGRLSLRSFALDPHRLAVDGPEVLQGVGVSRAKIACLMALATEIHNGTLDLVQLVSLPDDAAIARLTQVKGIGRWTAEMYLIFTEGREDIFAVDDAGLRRAVAMLSSFSAAPLDAAQIVERSREWVPYRTVASLFLWNGLDAGLLPLERGGDTADSGR